MWICLALEGVGRHAIGNDAHLFVRIQTAKAFPQDLDHHAARVHGRNRICQLFPEIAGAKGNKTNMFVDAEPERREKHRETDTTLANEKL